MHAIKHLLTNRAIEEVPWSLLHIFIVPKRTVGWHDVLYLKHFICEHKFCMGSLHDIYQIDLSQRTFWYLDLKEAYLHVPELGLPPAPEQFQFKAMAFVRS